ncbi:hypothetical protein [Propionibacterium australiense]|uniref:Uncharacterized protein n=1 Tax=Propionibacterium australiense TaxID=119981 RepID=A0A383S736_9ACTN|nr:hypothetical protein [Propionibacterium australiense]RLP09714.1 hypothetical protein D9T14_06170 [Propionibacterium australiense]SYZ33179.1 Hypothetical protein PROPAUS_1096 [Propionibacterium australiense]VEH89383.1 Uncharacterised protein [Propionibacterium australiense]
MELRFPMHRGTALISLLEVLSHIDGRGLFWNVSGLWAQTRHGSSLRILEMEEHTNPEPSPLWMTWFQLLRFAADAEQVIDGDFAGHTTLGATHREPIISITAFDSTEWTVSTIEPPRCDMTGFPVPGELDDAPWRIIPEADE